MFPSLPVASFPAAGEGSVFAFPCSSGALLTSFTLLSLSLDHSLPKHPLSLFLWLLKLLKRRRSYNLQITFSQLQKTNTIVSILSFEDIKHYRGPKEKAPPNSKSKLLPRLEV